MRGHRIGERYAPGLHVTDDPPDPRKPEAAGLDATIQPGDVTADALAAEPLLGLSLGNRYRVIGTLGRGAAGIVYRARDSMVNEDVAIKILANEQHDEKDAERFRRELVTARKVTHPNVIRIHDMVALGSQFFISMEILEGGTLSELLKRGPVPIARAIEIAIGICEGLEAAHKQRVIHRDLKPDNVLFDRDGVPKVVDFGLARLSGTLSRTAGFSGTPYYMSPEQADGREPTAQSDLYSLGVLFFELFTGQLPFKAETLVRLVVLHQSEAPPAPRSIRAEIPSHVDALLRRMLAKNPAQRPRSAAEVALLLRGDAHAAPAPPSAPRARGGWAVAAVGAVGLAAGIAILFGGASRDPATTAATPLAALPSPERTATPAPTPAISAMPSVASPTAARTAVAVASKTSAAATPTSVAPASLTVVGVGPPGVLAWVEVYVDDALLGSSPITADLAAGKHTLSFRRGGTRRDVDLEAASGASYKFSAAVAADGAVSIARTQ